MSSNAGPNARLAPLHGVQFLLEADPASILAIDEFRGRDNQISIILLEGGKAALRVHDEYTKGGRKLVFETTGVAPALPGIQVAAGDPMPLVLEQPLIAPEYVFIDVATGVNNVDLSNWLPTGLLINQRVQVRKIDTESGLLMYTCPHSGIVYRFVDRPGEFITLLWCGATFHII